VSRTWAFAQQATHDRTAALGTVRLQGVEHRRCLRGLNTVQVQWTAPEILKNGMYTEKADIFSFGVGTIVVGDSSAHVRPLAVLWEIVTQSQPWDGIEPHKVASLVLAGSRLEVPSKCKCPQALAGLLAQMWLSNPQKRPNFTEVGALLEKLGEEFHLYLAEK